MTGAGLEIRGVAKSYGAATVLVGTDLTVGSGQLTAVLGRSGCGKTTLLRLVAGFDRPDAGTITIDGREVAGAGGHLPPERRGVGYVTQEGNLFPHLTVAANIAFGLPRPARRGSPRVPELLELLRLEPHLASRYPHELSGGQQQRVALARALAPDPRILLLDEPFSALDVELRESTRRVVAAALAATGTTTLLVTHDRAEAMSLATRVAVMDDGHIVQEDAPLDLYRYPVDRRVAAFVGDVVAVPGVVRGGIASCVLGELPVASDRGDGPATLLLRPEQISLTTGPGTQASVRSVEFHGHDGVVGLVVDSRTDVVARCASHLLPATGDEVVIAVHGSAIAVDVSPTDAHPTMQLLGGPNARAGPGTGTLPRFG